MATTVALVFLLCCVYMILGASVYQQVEIKDTSKRYTRNVRSAADRTDSSFETESEGRRLQKNGNPVFIRTIENHIGLFLDSNADNMTFKEKMTTIFENREYQWKTQRDTIVRELKCNTDIVRGSKSAQDFYVNIIKLYTKGLDCVYKSMNAELREYRTTFDQSSGSYALLLNVVLSNWNLSKFADTTYHGVNFNTENYTVNKIFTWTGFTSSSKNRSVGCCFANTALFKISNNVVSGWRPRVIENFSYYPSESECLYPATAIFKVTDITKTTCIDWKGITKNVTEISISLLQDETQCCGVNRGTINGGRWRGVAFLALVAVVVALM